jgi:hypothetical protein
MTITCASRMLSVLSAVQCPVVLVGERHKACSPIVLCVRSHCTFIVVYNQPNCFPEEAAEVLEPHLISTLTDSTQALLLIGDDKQLKPKVNLHELEKDKNFAVSMFERLAKRGIPACQLHTQRRMRPLISQVSNALVVLSVSRLVLKRRAATHCVGGGGGAVVVGWGCLLVQFTKHLYDEVIRDHSRTTKYPPVRGTPSVVHFHAHAWPEETLGDTASKCNNMEAIFAVRLAKYFVQNGYVGRYSACVYLCNSMLATTSAWQLCGV